MDALNQGPEQQIIDTLERLLKSPDIFYAVRIFVSRLLPVHQNNNKIAIIFHILGENNYIYKLSNQDVILLIRNVKKKQLEQLFDSIRSLFPRDPAILKNPPEYFIKTYNLKSEYRSFVQDLNKLENEEKINKNEKYKIPLTPENLEEEIQRAKLSDIVDAIRKQPVITLAAQQKIKILFYEFFTSTTLLGQKAIPNVNLLSDPWLFQHLTETLDLKVIDAFDRMLQMESQITRNYKSYVLYSYYNYIQHILSKMAVCDNVSHDEYEQIRILSQNIKNKIPFTLQILLILKQIKTLGR